MKKLYKIIIAIITVVSFLFVYNLIFNDIKIYDYSLTIGNHVGLNVDTDKLYFGTILQGERSKRTLTIKNGNRKSKVIIKASGMLSDSIYVTENNFLLQENETKELDIYIFTEKNTAYGTYNGKVLILFANV